ncbi:TPA: hypothetical protein EYP84_01180, partial [Candidatus Bipolaricaulota bacterium]|nr:hypothetical protein [Candidatus Bipolaricaulota bacterium]
MRAAVSASPARRERNSKEDRMGASWARSLRSSSPIKVVQEIYTAGDTRAGVQTLAFNLPNDER